MDFTWLIFRSTHLCNLLVAMLNVDVTPEQISFLWFKETLLSQRFRLKSKRGALSSRSPLVGRTDRLDGRRKKVTTEYLETHHFKCLDIQFGTKFNFRFFLNSNRNKIASMWSSLLSLKWFTLKISKDTLICMHNLNMWKLSKNNNNNNNSGL